MPDVLLQTLWWSLNPSASVNDINGTGAFQSRAITAAEAHDASDATYEELTSPGDGFSDGDATTDLGLSNNLTAATQSPISFIRIITRGRVTRSAGAGSVFGTYSLRINGVPFGISPGLNSIFVTDTQTFATDPTDGLPWTPAKINAKAFGVVIAASTSDPSFATTALGAISEFTVEIWGTPVIQVYRHTGGGAPTTHNIPSVREYVGGVAATGRAGLARVTANQNRIASVAGVAAITHAGRTAVRVEGTPKDRRRDEDEVAAFVAARILSPQGNPFRLQVRGRDAMILEMNTKRERAGR